MYKDISFQYITVCFPYFFGREVIFINKKHNRMFFLNLKGLTSFSEILTLFGSLTHSRNFCSSSLCNSTEV